MDNYGVRVHEQATSRSAPLVTQTGVPFFIGIAPVQCAQSPAPVNEHVLCRSFDEAVEKLGFVDFDADDGGWKYNLCECMYSHFVLYGRQPAIFCNLLDVKSMTTTVPATDFPVVERKILLPIEVVDDSLVVKATGDGTELVKDSDYGTYYSGGNLVVEILPSGTAYYALSLNIEYSAIDVNSISDAVVAAGMQNIDKCQTVMGIAPDSICSPGYSKSPVVASIMAIKAAGINGIFKAKALIDIDASLLANTHNAAINLKKSYYLVDENQIACWPMLKTDGRIFHISTQLAGLIAEVDAGNNGCPYESPSNKPLRCDAIVLGSGSPISLTLEQANELRGQGIVTALSFMGEIQSWGSYTACYPSNNDPKDKFIPVSRMFDWVENTVIKTFWKKIDKPMTSRFKGSIVDICNIWLNGIVSAGYLLGARVEVRPDENPEENIEAGIIRVHIFITPPSPAQEMHFVFEYYPAFAALAFAA